MAEIIEGDITDVTNGIIMHQVNCQNRIGAGVSGAIIKKYPLVEKVYHNSFNNYLNKQLFCSIMYIPINDNLTVVNSYTQFYYGNSSKTGIVYTDMDSLKKAIHSVCNKNINIPVYVPYGIGCGLAGGNWNDLYLSIKDIPNLKIIKY